MNEDEQFENWLAGFIDGEGCFKLNQSSTRPGRTNWACTFELSLRADDSDILYVIAERTGLGQVGKLEGVKRGNPKRSWRVTSKAGCLGLVEILDRAPLRAKKRRDYEIWREAVLLWQGMVYGRGNNDWSRFFELREQLTETRRYQEVVA